MVKVSDTAASEAAGGAPPLTAGAAGEVMAAISASSDGELRPKCAVEGIEKREFPDPAEDMAQ